MFEGVYHVKHNKWFHFSLIHLIVNSHSSGSLSVHFVFFNHEHIALSIFFSNLDAEKTRLKVIQLAKVHFIKMNDLKLTQVELF